MTMAPHSSTLAWKIPWTEEPGGLQSTGSLRVGHDWVTSLSLFTFMQWRRKWQPTLVFLPGESQRQGGLVGCRQWGCRVGHNWSDLAAVAAVDFESKYKLEQDKTRVWAEPMLHTTGSEIFLDILEDFLSRQINWNRKMKKLFGHSFH